MKLKSWGDSVPELIPRDKSADIPGIRVLNLGAGVQSTTLFLMSMDDDESVVPKFDYAIFADTQEEPDAVYGHLEWLKSLGGPPILMDTAGKLGDDLASGINSAGERFASIPAYTTAVEGFEDGKTRRQCTKEYKVDVVGKVIRRQILELEFGQHIPKGTVIHQFIGYSYDEPTRLIGAKARFQKTPWAIPHFPLFDMEMTRGDCRAYLKDRVPHEVPRSACVFCPFKSNSEWRRLRDEDPKGWDRAVEVDAVLRRSGSIVSRGLDKKLYIHRSCFPLASAPIDQPDPPVERGFDFECESGMCGN